MAICRPGGARLAPGLACQRHQLLQRIETDIDVLAVSVLDSADTFLGRRAWLIENFHGFAQDPDFNDTSHGSILAGR
jgi:hypothetical protein